MYNIEPITYFTCIHYFITCLPQITSNDYYYVVDSDLCDWRMKQEVLVHVEQVGHVHVTMWNRTRDPCTIEEFVYWVTCFKVYP